jgi:pilus assembly protein Flp/PilA
LRQFSSLFVTYFRPTELLSLHVTSLTGIQLAGQRDLHLEETLMKIYRETLMNLLRDDSGQDLIEYALVAALIGLGAATVMGGLGNEIGNIFTSITSTLTTAA